MRLVGINPGTGDQPDATLPNAWQAIAAFIADLAEMDVTVTRVDRRPDVDQGGWFGFILHHDGKSTRVEMPGVPLAEVRESGPLGAVRVYVDGSSWLWGLALDAFADAEPED